MPPLQLDKLIGLAMLIIATTVFLYYTAWTLLMVRTLHWLCAPSADRCSHLWTTVIHSTASSHLESGQYEYPSSSPYWAQQLLDHSSAW